jgi:hypothetical protein
VPFGHFSNVLLTKDLVPLEPDVLEYKLTLAASARCWSRRLGAAGREELVGYTEAARARP